MKQVPQTRQKAGLAARERPGLGIPEAQARRGASGRPITRLHRRCVELHRTGIADEAERLDQIAGHRCVNVSCANSGPADAAPDLSKRAGAGGKDQANSIITLALSGRCATSNASVKASKG